MWRPHGLRGLRICRSGMRSLSLSQMLLKFQRIMTGYGCVLFICFYCCFYRLLWVSACALTCLILLYIYMLMNQTNRCLLCFVFKHWVNACALPGFPFFFSKCFLCVNVETEFCFYTLYFWRSGVHWPIFFFFLIELFFTLWLNILWFLWVLYYSVWICEYLFYIYLRL